MSNLQRVFRSLRNGHKYILPLATVPVNKSQKIIRNYCQSNTQKEAKVPVPAPTTTEHEDHQYEESVKDKILQQALDFVPKSGWSVESLTAGAEAAGYPGIAHGLFPNGGGDLVHYFNIKCNENLVEQMKNWPKEELKENKIPTKFIENAIMTRILMIDPYKSSWPKAMAIQTLPNNVPNCLATLLSLVDDICYHSGDRSVDNNEIKYVLPGIFQPRHTLTKSIQTLPNNVPNCLATLLSLVDDICYHSGDRSVDFNWYMRRVGLAGIYKATELFYLTDKSPDNSATRSFVASRIRDAQLIQTALNLNPVSAAPQTLSAAFVTAKNMLGMNTLK